MNRWNPFRDENLTRKQAVLASALVFVIAGITGWVYEEFFYYLNDGYFSLRGHGVGPWLPIYGGGCAAILAILFKLRKKPLVEFFMIIVLCGIIEYFSSWILEVTHDGQRWWDYSGYYLNLNGRICAEGLLVFGIGGAAFIYVLAPWADDLIVRIRSSVLWGICIALLAVFIADVIYSSIVPNTGKGITSSVDAPAEEEPQSDS